jgi:hypothetical protein
MGIGHFYNMIISESGINYHNDQTIDDVSKNATHIYIDFKSMIYESLNKCIFNANIELLEIILRNKTMIENEETQKIIRDYADEKIKDIQDSIIDEINSYFFGLKEKSRNLKFLYISNDGIPEFSKCVDQKQRRSMQNLQDRIEGMFKTLLKDKFIYENIIHKYFEKCKFKYHKIMGSKYANTQISFLEMVIKSLKANQTDLENYRNQKISVVIDNSYYDEGEVKIINHILNNSNFNDNDKILISSPDADVILLSCLVYYNLYKNNNKIYHIDYYNNRGIINIHDFIVNLSNKVIKNRTEVIRTHAMEINIAKDFVCIFTFLGNDFLPRISSMTNLYVSVPILIDIYSNICQNQNRYGKLVSFENNRHVINYDMFREYLKEIVENEREMYNGYININSDIGYNLKSNYILSDEYYFYRFVQCYNSQYANIRDCKEISLIEGVRLLNPEYETATELKNNLDKFIKDNYKRLLNINNETESKEQLNPSEILRLCNLIQKKIKGIMNAISNSLKEYDLEIIKFENKKEKWYNILNMDAPDYDNIDNPENIKYKCNEEEIENYLSGFGFVFNWYFDRMASSNYNENISTWFYKKNNKIILIRDIFEYLNNIQPNQNTFPFIMEMPFVKKNNYFKIEEHAKYITSHFIDKTHNEIYWFIENKNIDCKHKHYFDKCYLNIPDKSWEETIKNPNRKEFKIKYQIFKINIPSKLENQAEGGYYIKYNKYLNKNKKN